MQQISEGFDFLFHQHPRPMWVFDRETYAFLDVNDAAIRMYGYSRDEFLQMRITDIRLPEDIQAVLDFQPGDLTPIFEADGRVWRHRLKEGTLIEVRVSGSLIEYQNRPAALIAIDDVTEHLRTLQELRDQRTLVEQAAAIANIGSWSTLLTDSEHVQWSPEMYTIFGVDPATFIPLTSDIQLLITPDDLETSNTIAQAAMRTGGDYRTEMRIVRGDGELRWLRTLARVLLDETGTPTRIIGVCIDITEDKRRVEADRALTREIERRSLHERFMSMIAHEFRTPLTTIETSADLLYLYYPRMEAAQRDERINNIRSQIDHLVSLVDDMGSLLQAETVGLSYHPTITDLALLTATVFDEVRVNTRDERTLLYSADCTTCITMADKKLIRLALVNLLTNAIKYSGGEGRVWLNLRTEGEWLTIEVRDEGIGIPEADQTHLFDPFFRANNVGERPGTGLGLAIVKQAVEAHGGSVLVRSAIGRGTVFTLLLPNAH